MDVIVSKTKPKSTSSNEWKAAMKCLVNSLVHEPTQNGHISENAHKAGAGKEVLLEAVRLVESL